MPLHSCTEDELAKFYRPDQASAQQAEAMKELGAFQCLDVKAADFMLSGVSEGHDGFKFIDISVLPCHFKETNIGAKEDNILEDCVTDRDTAVEALKYVSLYTYYNYGKFIHDEFGEASIRK